MKTGLVPKKAFYQCVRRYKKGEMGSFHPPKDMPVSIDKQAIENLCQQLMDAAEQLAGAITSA